jgi:hypothetical protein
MYSKPYAIFEADRRSPAHDTRPAVPVKIDGEDVRVGDNHPVAPGLRMVEVSVPGAPGMSQSIRETMKIDAKPCTRYYLAARRPSMTSHDWSAFIESTEPIGECKRKFGIQ